MRTTGLATLMTCAWIACASAQTLAVYPPLTASIVLPVPTTPSTVEQTTCCVIPEGTVVDLEIMEPINSSKQHRGDYFALRLAEPLLVNGNIIIPAGTSGVGQIVHAQAAHSGGAPGELILAARHLDFGGRQLLLRGLKLGASGKDNSGLALGVSIAAGPFAMFIRGREIEIPAGTRVHAKLAQDFPLPAASDSPSTPTTVPKQEH